MKKLLLLMAALLLLIPPLRADVIFTAPTAVASSTTTGAKALPGLYYKLSTGTSFTQLNNYTARGNSTAYISDVKYTGISGDEVHMTNVKSSSGGLLYAKNSLNSATYVFKASKNSTTTFSALFGKITSVRVTFYTSVIDASTYWKLSTGTTRSKVGTSGYTFDFTNSSGNDISFSYTNGTIEISKIEITYEAGPAIAPEAPTISINSQSPKFHCRYDQNSKTLEMACFPAAAKIKLVTANVPKYGSSVYYTFDENAALPVSETELNGWTAYSGNILFAPVMPVNDSQVPKEFKLRLIGYSALTKLFGTAVETINCKVVRLPHPVVDVTKLGAGYRFDESTNTVYYTGVNPVVPVKFAGTMSSYLYTYYTTDFSDPLNSSTKGTVLSEKYNYTQDIKFTNWAEGAPIPPVGTTNQIKAISMVDIATTSYGEKVHKFSDDAYDEVNEKPVVTVINVVRELGSKPSAPTLVQATVDEKDNYTGSDIPSRIGFDESVSFMFQFQGTITSKHNKIFDAKPTGEVDASSWGEEIAFDGDKLTFTKANIPSGSTDAWIGLAYTDATGTSDPLWIHVGLKAPDAPKINCIRGSYDNGSERVVFGASLDANFTVGEDASVVEYCMEKVSGSVWPEAPGALTQRHELKINGSNTEKIDGEHIETGRLFYRAGREVEGATVWSEWAYTDFKRETVTPVSLSGKYTTWLGPVGDGTLVHIDEELRIMGYYTTNATLGVNNSSPSYLYVINKDGYVIKLLGTDLANGSWPMAITGISNEEYESKNYVLKGVYGWVKYVNNENNMPEIYLTNGSTYNSQALYEMLPVPVESAEWALTADGEERQNPVDRIDIDRVNDFSRYVTVRSLKWLGENNEFEMADGTRIPLYNRFKDGKYKIENYTANLVKGRLYCVRGFVGLASTTLAIFPNAEILQCPGTPNLFAPNPIKGDADENGFIDIQAVSDKVTFRVEGNADSKSEFTYTINGGEEVDVVNHSFEVVLSALKDEEKMELVVYAHLNGMKSLEPAKVRITKREAEQVASIEEFKTLEFANPDPDKIYQITGKVVIEAKTDKYLYVRDFNDAPEAEMDENEHLRRLLIKNTINPQGWATEFEKNGTAAPLEVGDVIYGFAITPTHDRGNLLGNNDGFARTIKFDRNETTGIGNYETVNAAPTDNFEFDGKYRMVMVKLHGVELKPRVENIDPATKEDFPYIYTLDLKTPTSMRMDVFVRTGFAAAYAEGVGFDLTGIVMIDNEDNSTEDKGNYAFALMNFEGTAQVAAPKVFIAGQEPTDDEVLDIDYTGTATIKMTAEPVDTENNDLGLEADQKVTIYYTINGLDPLKDITRKIYVDNAPELALGDGDIEVRAFAAAPGRTPSAVVTRRFKKNSHDVQFILNFLQSAKEGEAYRFTGDTKVVAMGGDYMFVVGRVGHYLPIELKGGWADKGFSNGDLLTGFTVRFHEDENGNRIAVADDFESTFKSSGTADPKFTHEPDVTDALDIERHPRRLVTLKGVTASASDAASIRDIDKWSISESGDHETHALKVGILGDVNVYAVDEDGNNQPVAEGLADGATYDITGFVMLNDPSKEAKMEVWPLEAKLLRKTSAVTAKIGDGNTQSTNGVGEITASFEGMTMVSLACPSKNSKIYYAFDPTNGFSGDNLTWYEYQHEFAVTKDTYIHAKAVAPNAVESDHTHIVLTALSKSGDVDFNVTPGDGITTLTITPAAGAAAGSTIWYSEGNDRSCNKVYTAGTELKYTEETTVYACIQEPGKAKGAVSSIRVVVVDMPQGGGNDNAKVSGKVVFTIDDTSDPEKVTVYLAPEEGLTGTIYYLINPTEQVTPDNGTKYENPIEMKEGGRIMAILVEEGKLAGEPTDIAVWLIPTDITGIDAEDREDAIRAEGGSIIAPEGSEVYDITGRRVSTTGLRAGIYIVRTPGGKAVKVKVD